MKVHELIELLDGVNPEYEVTIDNYTLEDCYQTDYKTKTITLEILRKVDEILQTPDDFIPSNYTAASVDIHDKDTNPIYRATVKHS